MRETGIKYTLDLQDFVASVKQIPNITDQQLDKMVRVWVRRNNQVTKEMARAAKAAENAAKTAEEKQRAVLEGAKNAAEGLGGSIGGVAGQIEKAIKAASHLGSALGPTGMVIGAATVGLGLVAAAAGAAAAGIVGIVEGAEEALDRLREIEGTEPISQADLVVLDDYGAATLGLEAAALRLHVALASDLAPSITTVVDGLALAVDVTTDLYEGLQELAEATTGAGVGTHLLRAAVTSVLGPVAGITLQVADWLGVQERVTAALRSTRDELVDTAKSTDALAAAAGGAATRWDEMVEAMGRDSGVVALERSIRQLEQQLELTTQLRLATGEWTALDAQLAQQQFGLRAAAMRQEHALAEAERERREAEREHAKWEREQALLRARDMAAERMLLDVRRDTMSAEEMAIEAAEQRARQIDELAAAGADAALIEQLRLENTRRLTRELAEIERQRHEESARLDAERMARIEAMYREQTRLAEEAARAELQAQRQVEDAAVQMYGGLSRLASAYADAVVSGREDMTDAEQRAALAAFEMSRATALAQIAIQQGLAIARALAELGPIAGPIAAIGIGAEVLAQGIAIAQQPPPQFPTGGVVTAASLGLSADHGLVGVQAGEGIVSRRGMEALGEDGLAAINRGEPPVQRVEVVMQYRHRIFDRFIRDNLQRSGPLASAIGGGRRVGHYGV